MKKITILLTAFLLCTQVVIQAQIRMNQNSRHFLHHQSNTFKEGCGKPSSIFIDEITSTSATIHWNTNGAMHYKVVYINNKDKTDRGALITPLGSVAIDNLTPCNNYQVIIIAKCPDGIYRSYPQVFSTLGCN